jgi:hypothetical protein
LKVQVASAKRKALVELVCQKRMWIRFEKLSNEVGGNTDFLQQ